jgi:uncharacterized RDD family membrane protein YckC
MKQTIIDNDLQDYEPIIATTKQRLLAYGIDWLIHSFCIINGFLLVSNKFHWFILPSSLVFFPLYKIFAEFYFGATIGKQILGLQIEVDNNQHSLFTSILKRNLPQLIKSGLMFVAYIPLLQAAQFSITSINYSAIVADIGLQVGLSGSFVFGTLFPIFYAIDGLYFFTSTKGQTLRDYWADTLVIIRI